MKEYILPYLSKTQQSRLKIVTNSGDVFYAHNILPEYRYDERIAVFKNWGKYFKSINEPSPEQDAYCVLLWHLFPDFLNAYNFNWVRKSKSKQPKKKHLYILQNNKGFIKVGVASNIDMRLVDLKYEFEGEFKILKIYQFMSNMEGYVHGKLMDYIKPIHKRHGGISQECFEDCKEVLDVCMNLS